MMRDHDWLYNKLQYLLKNHFADMPLTNPIEIRFGREAKFRFGSIKLQGNRRVKRARGAKGLSRIFGLRKLEMQESGEGKVPRKSIITITSMFASNSVPSEVVLYTIAHELCHYAHGFSSSNRRLFRHPHHGGIVNRELERRGAGHLVTSYRKWIKEYRKNILASRVVI